MLYLAPFVGSGVKGDPFRPRGWDAMEGWQMIDLRPDPTVSAGFCLLHAPASISDGLLDGIGLDKTEVLGAALKTTLGSKLGFNFASLTTIETLMQAILFVPHGKWATIRPGISGRKEVWMGGQRWAVRQLPPGAPSTMDPSDTFTRANSADLGTSWDVQTGENSWTIVSNQAQPSTVGSSGDCTENWNANVFNDNQFSEATIAAISGGSVGGDEGIGVALRCATAAQTFYRLIANAAATSNTGLSKKVAGVYTNLGFATASWAANDVIRGEVDGSMVRIKRNGTLVIQQTDTSITTGRAGISYSSSLTTALLDNWNSGDLTLAAYDGRAGARIQGGLCAAL